MRPALTKVVAASLAALLVGATATTSEAAFAPRFGGGGFHGGWHGGGWHGGGWHGGGWGLGGLAAGAIIGSALAAPYGYYGYGYGGCYRYQPVYSPDGVYLGTQLVNVC